MRVRGILAQGLARPAVPNTSRVGGSTLSLKTPTGISVISRRSASSRSDILLLVVCCVAHGSPEQSSWQYGELEDAAGIAEEELEMTALRP